MGRSKWDWTQAKFERYLKVGVKEAGKTINLGLQSKTFLQELEFPDRLVGKAIAYIILCLIGN
jgi:hypothetical protein